MAITSSAKKAIRSAARKRVFNIRRADHMREEIKKFQKLVAGGKVAEAEKMLSAVYKAVDKAMKRGVIKKNTAARKKSRLVKFLRKKATKK